MTFEEILDQAIASRWREIRACNNNTCGESKGQTFQHVPLSC
jgi:hypothetical protein